MYIKICVQISICDMEEILYFVSINMWTDSIYTIRKADDQPRQHIKKQRHSFANKGLDSQG